MPPKYANNNKGSNDRSSHHREGNGNGNNNKTSYASVVQANASAAAPANQQQGAPSNNNQAKKVAPIGVDLNASPDELQAQMHRLLSEVDRVRNALEQRKGPTPPANNSPDDEDDEVLRLQYANSAAAASLDDDQPQQQQAPLKKSRGYSPNISNAVAKAFSQHDASSGNGGDKRGGGSPLMDQQAWLQKMLKQMPAGTPPAPAGSAPGRSFQSPPPLPAGPRAHDMSTLSSVPDTSALSDQDQMWAPNGGNDHHHGMWQQQPQQHGGNGRGRGGNAMYTNPHRTGAMSYRQNHHHDSIGDGARGGRGRGGLFSDDGSQRQGYNEYVTTKDYVVVEFKRERTKKYPCATKVQPGEYVIVDGDRGQDCGLVIQVAYAKEDGTFEVQCIDAMLKNYVRTKPERARVLRVATPEEVSFLHTDIDAMEKAALQTCKAKCDELGITDLKLVDCEFQFDRQKVSFFFDSERSIDFRALVRDLHRAFGIRIWMENINPGVKNSVPADAQADVMWTGEDTAQQRLLGGLGMGVGGSTMMMMSAGPAMSPSGNSNNSNGGYRGGGRGMGGGMGRGNGMRR